MDNIQISLKPRHRKDWKNYQCRPMPLSAAAAAGLWMFLQTLYRKNPHMRIVINAISMETIAELKEVFGYFFRWRRGDLPDAGKPGEEAFKLSSAPGGKSNVWICSFTFGRQERIPMDNKENKTKRRGDRKRVRMEIKDDREHRKKIRRIMIAAPKGGSKTRSPVDCCRFLKKAVRIFLPVNAARIILMLCS